MQVVTKPGDYVGTHVDLGFAGSTAPGRRLLTAMSRGRHAGGRAAVFVYLDKASVRVDITDAPWTLFIASHRDAGAVVERLRRELG